MRLTCPFPTVTNLPPPSITNRPRKSMPSTRASKSTTRSGLRRQSQASPPASTTRKRATSSVADSTQAKKTKVDVETPESQTKKKKKDKKKEKYVTPRRHHLLNQLFHAGKLQQSGPLRMQRLACPLTSKGELQILFISTE